MTIDEYREKHPDCEYCSHRLWGALTCPAINKTMSKRRARRCPCYIPKKWNYSTDEKGENK